MKVIYFLLIFLIGPFTSISFGQETTTRDYPGESTNPKTIKKLTRREKKELKDKEKADQLKIFYDLIDTRKFVIEIDQLITDQGKIITLNSNINFFLIENDKSTIQIASIAPAPDQKITSLVPGEKETLGVTYFGDKNGVSSEGRITEYNLDTLNSKKPVLLHGRISRYNGGTRTFNLSCNSKGVASVTLRSQNSIRVTFQGKLYSLEGSQIYNRRRGEDNSEDNNDD